MVIGDCLWVGASGFADVRTREPVRAEAVFEVGSVTKTFVAALVLKLAEDGVLGLGDRLSRWVPEFPVAAESRCASCSTTPPAPPIS
jgi:CubicO group peptidase (beta-lactamase class C family)